VTKQGTNREFARKWPRRRDNRLENIREFSGLRDGPPEIPCATEQGIHSTATGKQFATNRELIRITGNSLFGALVALSLTETASCESPVLRDPRRAGGADARGRNDGRVDSLILSRRLTFSIRERWSDLVGAANPTPLN
jgi:hypothetical protein